MSNFLLLRVADHEIMETALGYDPRVPGSVPKAGLAWYEWFTATDDQRTPGGGTVVLAPVRVYDDVAFTVTDTTVLRDETPAEIDARKFTEVDNEMKGVAALSFNDVHNFLLIAINMGYQLARVSQPTLTKPQFQTALFNFIAGVNGITGPQLLQLIHDFEATAEGITLQMTKNYLKGLKDE